MSQPVDGLYFDWLCLHNVNGAEVYTKLLRLLHCKEYVWSVPNDDNRIEDGRALRIEFMEKTDVEIKDPGWLRLGCSMLELLIGMSRRLQFMTEESPSDWFWEMLTNIGLNFYDDHNIKHVSESHVDDVLEQVIWRTYRHDGYGGLFPLQYPSEDQRHVELWYQMTAYVLERL